MGVFDVHFLYKPLQRDWAIKLPGTCTNAEHHFWSASIIGIVLSKAIWILPVPIVEKLSLPRRQKLGLLEGFVLSWRTVWVSVRPSNCFRQWILQCMHRQHLAPSAFARSYTSRRNYQ